MAIQEQSADMKAAAESKSGDEQKLDNILRPAGFEHFVGQKDVVDNLLVFCTAAKNRGETLDHTLLYGPPGLGKTTLSMILASKMGSTLRQTSGPALEKPGDVASILTNLQHGDILFIDEIHRLKRTVEELLYTAMEDYAIDLVVGSGPGARTMRLSVPPFTLIGATTQMSLLSSPLRDRFGHTEKLRFYTHEEIQQIIQRSAGILETEISNEAAAVLAKSARRTPRIANRLLRRVRDFAAVGHDGVVTESIAWESLKRLSIDAVGLDYNDQQYLNILTQQFHGGPVGVGTIAAAMSESVETIEEVIEPYLIREGLLNRTPKGRKATQKAFEHLGIQPPKSFQSTLL